MKHLEALMKFDNNLTREKYRNETVEILAHPTAEQLRKLFRTAIGALRRKLRAVRHGPLSS
jgi:hypothetical protein